MKILKYLEITVKILLLVSITYLGTTINVSKNSDKKVYTKGIK